MSKVFEQRTGLGLQNSIKMPTFGGTANKDLDSFLEKFNRIARIQNWGDDRKTNMLPMYRKEHADAWFETTPELHSKKFNEVAEELKKKFDSESTKYWLRQSLHD
mgnify:CR=1 FL=1